jgi:hypothetical protein
VPAVRVSSRSVLATPDAVTASAAGGGPGLYARVSSHGQEPGLGRQIARAEEARRWAARDVGPASPEAAG